MTALVIKLLIREHAKTITKTSTPKPLQIIIIFFLKISIYSFNGKFYKVT